MVRLQFGCTGYFLAISAQPTDRIGGPGEIRTHDLFHAMEGKCIDIRSNIGRSGESARSLATFDATLYGTVMARQPCKTDGNWHGGDVARRKIVT